MPNIGPKLKERLLACATFSFIFLAGLAAFDQLITGGFDFMPAPRAHAQAQPAAIVLASGEGWRAAPAPIARSNVVQVGYLLAPDESGPAPSDYDPSVSADDLAGGPDASLPSGRLAYNYADLRQQIQALYEYDPRQDDGAHMQRLAEIDQALPRDFQRAAYAADEPAPKKPRFTASETASPW